MKSIILKRHLIKYWAENPIKYTILNREPIYLLHTVCGLNIFVNACGGHAWSVDRHVTCVKCQKSRLAIQESIELDANPYLDVGFYIGNKKKPYEMLKRLSKKGIYE